MARRARLSLGGIAHALQLRGHNGSAIVLDAQDADGLLQAMREAATSCRVVVHAYALLRTRLSVLATPSDPDGVSRLVQALGRRYVAGFNRRHGRRGALWDGRFRSALVESGPPTLTVMRLLDGEAWTAPAKALPMDDFHHGPMSTGDADAVCRSSAVHRTGGPRDPLVVDPPEYWSLGNTPFDRESRYRALLGDPVPPADRQRFEQALGGGWAYGGARFMAELAKATSLPLAPRPRGRPRRTP